MLIYKLLTSNLLLLVGVISTLINFVKVSMNTVTTALPFC